MLDALTSVLDIRVLSASRLEDSQGLAGTASESTINGASASASSGPTRTNNDRRLTLERSAMPRKKLAPDPGEILVEEVLKPLAATEYRLAKALGASARRINKTVHDKRAITADAPLFGIRSVEPILESSVG